MPKVRMPRFTSTVLTVPTVVAEQGNKFFVPDRKALTFMSAAQVAAMGALLGAPPRPPQLFPAGSVVCTSVDDGSVRVVTPSQFSTVFETSPEGGNVRAVSAAATQTQPTGGTFITTNSDGTINVGNASTHVLMKNSSTGEERAMTRADAGTLFEST